MKFRSVALILTLAGAASALRAQSQNAFTQTDLDNWLDNVENGFELLYDRYPPGYSFEWYDTVCVDGEDILIQINVFITQDGTPWVTQEPNKNTGDPCKPSQDQFGNPLENQNTVFNPKTYTLRGSSPPPGGPGPDLRPLATPPTNAYVFTAPFRDIPFPPLYPLSAYPTPPACNPNLNASLLIVNHDNSSVTRVMACTGQQVAVIAVPESPLQVSGTPDGATAIVTSFSGAVSFIDLTSNQVAGTLNLPSYNPSGIAISPDGTLAYVTSFSSSDAALLVIDIGSQSVAQTIPLTGYPQSVVLTPDGSQAWVTDPIDGQFTVLDLLSGTVSRTYQISRPIGVAFNSTATQAWITTGNGTVQVLDTSTYLTIQTITVGAGPGDILIAPDDSVALVNNFVGQTISVISPATFAVVNTIPLPGPPMGSAITQ
jgi:YVTN family beta-propeller protein